MNLWSIAMISNMPGSILNLCLNVEISKKRSESNLTVDIMTIVVAVLAVALSFIVLLGMWAFEDSINTQQQIDDFMARWGR